ncbi:unnamed protein product [Rhodiola kirilowii]
MPTGTTVPTGTTTLTSSSSSSDVYAHPSDDPLFVSHNENIGVPLVTQLLTGSENYITWRKSMERALGVKMKLGFVKGDFPKPTDAYQRARWDKCNNVVLTWISNSVSKEIAASIVHCTDSRVAWDDLSERFAGSVDSCLFAVQQEIAELMQGDLSVAGYYGKLIQLWGDEDDLMDDEHCDLGHQCKAAKCSTARKMKNRIMKFLMGLNEDYLTVRSQALQMQPSPTLAQI